MYTHTHTHTHITFLAIFVVDSDLDHPCGLGSQNVHVLSISLVHGAHLGKHIVRPPQLTPWTHITKAKEHGESQKSKKPTLKL